MLGKAEQVSQLHLVFGVVDGRRLFSLCWHGCTYIIRMYTGTSLGSRKAVTGIPLAEHDSYEIKVYHQNGHVVLYNVVHLDLKGIKILILTC